MSRIRILADDLTGALDSAAAFTGDVPVYLDAAPADEAPGGAPVAVVATATRDVTLDALPDLLAPSIRWLAEATVAFKKVDSLLRGNSCAESAYVARAGAFDTLVFAPAFPAQRRLTLDGRHWVVPAGKALAQREPIGTGRIADAFAVLGLPVAGSDDVTGRPRVAIPDVGSDDDLARIAVGSVGPSPTKTLWCGSAGLAHAIAAAHGLAAPPDRVEPTAAGRGPVLVISASHHPVVRKQWGVLKGAERGALMASHGQPAALRAAFRAMGHPFDFALFDLSPTRTLPPADAAALLARQLGAIVAEAPRPGTLVVVGGDTLRALCRAAAASALVACPALRPGWGCARLVGGTWDGVRCHTRSGAFGDPDDLRTMLRLVAGRTEPLKETPP
jgi:uncharacterized protein YgbK (DUF1537 family)